MISKDPGLFTDATGEGMAGATDVRLSTQKTLYNGSASCKNCGYTMDPYEALLDELCPSCQRRQAKNRLKGGMA
jgi:predicted Zn-ribbon and HTH transcriptional regulator